VAEALELGIGIAGFSFHVGSQTDAVEPFVTAVTRTIELMTALGQRHGIRFTVLDIGGGFPVTHREASRTAPEIGRVLAPLLAPLAKRMEIVAEPGRCIVADAGIAVSRVIGMADRDDGRWYYLDDGVYGSYSNVMTEDVHPLLVAAAELDGQPAALGPVTLAGPTCDSVDVIARGYPMPELAVGDLVLSPTMGAYTAVTSCRFNGREPATVLPAALATRRGTATGPRARHAAGAPAAFAPVPARAAALR
jgi:ornithine decarboxylase